MHDGQVTFGGSSLDRAAYLRADSKALAALKADPASAAVVFWRGKPLCSFDKMLSDNTATVNGLMALPMSHALLDSVSDQLIFLGLNETGGGYFAADISGWEPAQSEDDIEGQVFDASLQQHPALSRHIAFADLRNVMTLLSAREAELAATARAVLSWHDSHRFCSKCGAPSVLDQAGWQRTCISCETPHFPRTDPVVIMLVTYQDHVLMGRSPGWPEGMYSLLAGFVEPGETIEAAVRREVVEEAGVKVGTVTYQNSQPWAFPMSLMFGCSAQATSHEITVDPDEIEDAIWLSKQDVMDIFAGVHPRITPARRGAIAYFLLEKWLADRLG